MNETIRAYIKRRVRWCMAIGIGGWAVIATSIGTRIDNPIVRILGFLMFGGAILALQWIKCPRYSVRLGKIEITIGVRRLKPHPTFCPYCGVSLDEPRAKHTPADQQAPF